MMRRHARTRRQLLVGFAVAMSGVPALLAGPAAAATSGQLVDVGGGINCDGVPFNPGPVGGTVTASVVDSELRLDFVLSAVDPSTVFSVEVFESGVSCGSDDAAATGQSVISDASGAGTGAVTLALPHPTLGGATLGDGAGTERAVIVLDRTNSSTGGGDRYVAVVDLAGTDDPPSCPTDGAIHQWRADGTTADSIGGADGVWGGSPSYVPGATGSAFGFDGTNVVEVDDALLSGLPTASFTVSASFRAEITSNYQVIAHKFTPNFAPTGDDAISDSWYLALTPTGQAYYALEIQTSGGRADSQFVGGPDLRDGQWHEMAMTYDGTRIRMYVDGGLLDEIVVSGVVIDSPGIPIRIGQGTNHGVPDWALHGAVDDLTLWNRTLSGAEIAGLGTGCDTTPPVITFTGNAGTYDVADTIDIFCLASDDGSGIASATCPEIHGPAYDHLGSTTLTATATDQSGNTAEAQTTFTVTVSSAGAQQAAAAIAGNQNWVPSIKRQIAAIANARTPQARQGALGALANALQDHVVDGSISLADADLIVEIASVLP